MVQVRINRRPRIGRYGHLDQSEAYDLSQLDYGPITVTLYLRDVDGYFNDETQISRY